MIEITQTINTKKWAGWIGAMLLVASLAIFASVAQAAPQVDRSNKHVLTIYDGGSEHGILTEAKTLGEALKQAGVELDKNDITEPGLDEELVAGAYNVNIYRARPVMVVDGSSQTKIMSPYRSAKQIAKQAGIELRPEDEANLTTSTLSVMSDGAIERMEIDRATAFNFIMYGQKVTAYTQAKTVAQMLAAKNIKLTDKDYLSVNQGAPIEAGMTIKLSRDGKQTITVNEKLSFKVEQIQDANREVGYRDVKTAGKNGQQTVTYEIVMKNGEEVSRKRISSVVTKQASKQVEVVGTKSKSNFSYKGGPLSDAQINALGQCESGMNPATNTGNGFSGAFQFSAPTWNNMGTGYAYAHQAPLDVQKQAVQKLLSGSSIYSQFPSCARQMSASGIL